LQGKFDFLGPAPQLLYYQSFAKRVAPGWGWGDAYRLAEGLRVRRVAARAA